MFENIYIYTYIITQIYSTYYYHVWKYILYLFYSLTIRHVDAIFGNVLSRDSELLPLDDYKIAMKTLSVHYYDPCPVQVVPGHIDRQTFCTEA